MHVSRALQAKKTWSGALALCATLLISACGGGGGEAQVAESGAGAKVSALAVATPQPSITVISLAKVSETRVSRTVYDYVFKVSIQNLGLAQTGVVANLIRVGTGTTIVDGSVVIGEIAANATVSPTDTITLRQDRTFALDMQALVWAFTGRPLEERINGIVVPPEPIELANNSTIGGIDSNNNGLRDDVERLLAKNYGLDSQFYAIAALNIKTLQATLGSPSPSTVKAHLDAFRCIVDTKKLVELNTVIVSTLNTPERRRAYGLAFAGSSLSQEGC